MHLDRRLIWLAIGLGRSLFIAGATYGHVYEVVEKSDYAPYNFLTIFVAVCCSCCSTSIIAVAALYAPLWGKQVDCRGAHLAPAAP